MTREAKPKKEIQPLTGVRAIAALAVVFYHMQKELAVCHPQITGLIRPITAHGYLGVDLFFILSGFIIYYNYSGKLAKLDWRAITEFLWMRLARIWPVHMFLLLIFALTLWLKKKYFGTISDPALYSTPDFFRNVFLVQSWGIPTNLTWNVPAWSISCEWLAYLFFPIIAFTKLFNRSMIFSVFGACFALIGIAIFGEHLHGGAIRYGIVRITGEFLAGCALCSLFRSGNAGSLLWKYIVPTTSLVMILCCYTIIPKFGLNGFCLVPFIGAIILGLAHNRCFVSKLCSMKPMIFGGYISYSVYMVHELCLIFVEKLDKTLGNGLAIVELLVIIASGTALYYLVENPSRKLMRNIYPRHKQAPYPVI